MILAPCPCGFVMHTPEAGTNRLTPCPKCGRQLVFASAARLPPDVGSSDFDCFVEVEEAGMPARTYLLGGSADIPIGDSPDCVIRLTEDRGAGRIAVLRRGGQAPSKWHIIPAQVQGGTIQGVPLRPASLSHGDVLAWPHPRVRMRYHTHVTAQPPITTVSDMLTLPAIPVGPAIMAMAAFLLAIGSGVIWTILPIPSRDVRILLTLLMLFIIAPSLWIAALTWGLVRGRTAQANIVWVVMLVLLALAAVVARAAMGLL